MNPLMMMHKITPGVGTQCCLNCCKEDAEYLFFVTGKGLKIYATCDGHKSSVILMALAAVK